MKGRAFAVGLLAAGALATVFAAAATGAPRSNGIESKTPLQIVAAAAAAGETAKSVHVSANLGQLAFDLQLVAAKGGKGRMIQNGVAFDLVRIGRNAYFRGSDAFWRTLGGTAAVQLFHGKWMRASATKGDLASLTPITNLPVLIRQTLGSHGKLTKGTKTVIHGQHVIAIRDTSKGGTLYVATDGKPYPVAIVNAKEHGTVYFDRWNGAVALAVPAHSIDITKLKK